MIRHKLILSFILYTLYSILYTLTPTARASTDPQNATVSATATIPSASANPSDNTSPYPIILIAPVDGTITNQSRPEFSWRQTSDPDSNTILYTLSLNGVATYLGISNTGNTQKSNFVSHIGDGNIYLTPTTDLPQGNYNWQVSASDLSSNQSISSQWHFTIDQTPPSLQIVDIDGIYQNPSISEGSNFDLTGPQEVNLIIATEPWATVSLKVYDGDNPTPVFSQSYPTNSSGLAYPVLNLNASRYNLDVTSFDQAGYTTTLPRFSLTLSQPTYNILIPGIPGFTTPSNITYNIPTIPTLPATVSQINIESNVSIYLTLLLAVALLTLLIFIWYRKPNILIIDITTNQPIRSIKIYHSTPTSKHHGIFVSKRNPLLYQLNSRNHGLAHINHLGRYSTLTLRTPDNRTLILSISRSQRFYTLSV